MSSYEDDGPSPLTRIAQLESLVEQLRMALSPAQCVLFSDPDKFNNTVPFFNASAQDFGSSELQYRYSRPSSLSAVKLLADPLLNSITFTYAHVIQQPERFSGSLGLPSFSTTTMADRATEPLGRESSRQRAISFSKGLDDKISSISFDLNELLYAKPDNKITARAIMKDFLNAKCKRLKDYDL
ncbi:hypothetical protein MBM_06102 [Drepanopeziza brunnea f. sp. 'multigermtubi' MB_m1]|uniref:Uncharacterized protein n=1 Tax=Marssonina brunnea f. sp. multigermtubi (strain MB_m1) TaxID=1072389 RepID=K1WSQ2_MARBU|nr:uncharacterized protein MBM_06102 [Drepanopeziza brunnea f. sp. 'multigermtubi' MB_m1]EKD16091.1 hypothetical protein MBM_06102 [Drepanopeziza brunnea f. sp. 'multigermtubi' MB_m1]